MQGALHGALTSMSALGNVSRSIAKRAQLDAFDSHVKSVDDCRLPGIKLAQQGQGERA